MRLGIRAKTATSQKTETSYLDSHLSRGGITTQNAIIDVRAQWIDDWLRAGVVAKASEWQANF
jgi:hypothetical protein